ncbi:hypothetical protein C3F22_09105 [Acinetobacter sp. ACNIH1]|nr:hypothetical protein C3F22_09105 [Acinetobacter sp. ACNIH1]
MIENYFAQHLGVKVTFLQCNVLDQTNTCWKEADLMILGSNTGRSITDQWNKVNRLLALVKI